MPLEIYPHGVYDYLIVIKNKVIMRKIIPGWLCLLPSFFISFFAYAHQDDVLHHHSNAHSQEQNNTIRLIVSNIQDKDNYKIVKIKLEREKNSQGVALNELQTLHTEKIHLLIIDDSLDDYSHIHPKALKEPGFYEFIWHPQKKGHYRIWANLLPTNTKHQEYIFADINLDKEGDQDKNKNIPHTQVTESNVGGYNFTLTFDQKTLLAGKPSIASINIKDNKGNPVTNLEPIMGAFAHIVGFSEDMTSILHVHPMGKEPSQPSDKGGPVLIFHIEPEKPGFIKIFAQVKINGKEIFVPFGIIAK